MKSPQTQEAQSTMKPTEVKFFVYIIRGIDGYTYCGFTGKLVQRMQAHQQGRSISTRKHRPFVIKYLHECNQRTKARFIEKMIKGQGVTRWLNKQTFTGNKWASDKLIEAYTHARRME